jgi:hypothetical protein
MIGVVAALAGVFFVVATVCAIGGIEEMYTGRLVYGWDGAQRGMLFFVFFGVMKVWPFPAIALAGAAAGVLVSWATRRRGTPFSPGGVAGGPHPAAKPGVSR